MSSLSVKAPKADPAIAAAQKSEQARADAAFVTNTQSLEDEAMRKRARRLGTRANLAGTPGVAGGYGTAGGTYTGGGSGSQYNIPMIDLGAGIGGFRA